MTDKLKILILEDVLSDLELVKVELDMQDIRYEYLHVETKDAFLEGLCNYKPDVILSDYSLPQFDGMTALKLSREISPDVPFIIVTGSINEDTAVACIKGGAEDYIVKGHYRRLGSAIISAIEKSKIKKQKEIAQLRLSEREKQFRSIFEHAAVGIIYFDLDGMLVLANNRFCEFSGYSQNEIMKLSIRDFIHQEHAEEDEEMLLRVIADEIKKFTVDRKCILKNGKIKWINISVSLLSNVAGQPLYFIGVIKDITARKEAERKQDAIVRILAILNRPNQWQKLLGDILLEIKNFIDVDAVALRLRGKESFVFVETLGYTDVFISEECEIMNHALFGATENKISSEAICDCMCRNIFEAKTTPFLPYFSEGGSFFCNCTAFLFPKKKLHGAYNKICKRYNDAGFNSIALIPLCSGNEIIGLLQFSDKKENIFSDDLIAFFEEIGTAIGIAYKRIVAEALIKESEERFRSLYENATVGIYRTTPNGKVVMANPRLVDMLKYPSLEKLLVTHSSKLGYVDKSKSINFANAIKKNGTIYGFEAEWLTYTGEVIWIRESARLIKNDIGSIIYYEGIVEDISAIKKAEFDLIQAKEKAERSDRLKTEFLAQISHEIRTPINVMLNFADLIVDDVQNSNYNDIDDSVSHIHVGGNRIIRTIDLILNMAELQTGSFEPNMEKMDLYDEVLVVMEQNFRHLAKAKQLTMIFEKKANDTKIFADSYSVNQIFSQLIDNAVKYTEDGYIKVTTANFTPGKLTVTVADTGIGIAKEYLPLLFEPFIQEEHGYTRRFEGNGLGLALVKKYCEVNNAEINVISEKGKGSSFSVTFDLVE